MMGGTYRGDPFKRALAVTLEFEGGYVNHPADPGGATNKGIIQRTYDAWRRAEGLPVRSVREIEDYEVEVIYRTRFWFRAKCHREPWPQSLLLFDWSVNSGVGIARPAYERLGEVPDPAAYLQARWNFIERLLVRRPSSEVFRRGWARRVNKLCAVAGVAPVAQERKAA